MKFPMNLFSHFSFTKHLLPGFIVTAALVGVALANVTKQETQPHHEEKAALISDAQLKTAGVELAKAGPATLHETISLYGTVEANGEKIQRVAARFVGVLRSVNKKVGDSVEEGDLLATVESNESLKTYALTSRLKGVVAERNINMNEQTGDKTLFVIADLSSVWVDLAVFPRDVQKIRLGQKVRITNPNNSVAGEGDIIAVAVLGTHQTQALSARVLLDNPDRQWTPGLFVNADVLLGAIPVGVAVHADAIQDHEGKPVVFVKGKNGFEPRAITLGRTDGQFTEVVSGLTAGETYASKNSFIIKAELGKDGAEHE